MENGIHSQPLMVIVCIILITALFVILQEQHISNFVLKLMTVISVVPLRNVDGVNLHKNAYQVPFLNANVQQSAQEPGFIIEKIVQTKLHLITVLEVLLQMLNL
jgi:hypothetical protein